MAAVNTAPQVSSHPVRRITWAEFTRDCGGLVEEIRRAGLRVSGVFGVPSGGCHVAQIVAHALEVPVLDEPERDCVVVDDLIDSGKTIQSYSARGHMCLTLYRKPHSPPGYGIRTLSGWLQFPWEHSGRPEDAVTRLLEFIGEDPTRDGLIKTPERVCRAFAEMTAGYAQTAKDILGTVFETEYDQVIMLRDIQFSSLCEHHMLPFSGLATVAYLPGTGKVVGISKLARLVQMHAKRLQIQERMTSDIADDVMNILSAKGAAVIIRAKHLCMGCRGIKDPVASMVTSEMRGLFREDATARAELFSLEK